MSSGKRIQTDVGDKSQDPVTQMRNNMIVKVHRLEPCHPDGKISDSQGTKDSEYVKRPASNDAGLCL